MSFLPNECRFILGILPAADGTIDKRDALHVLGIFPYTTRNRHGAAQSDMTVTAALAVRKLCGAEAQADVVLTATINASRNRYAEATADVEVSTYLTAGIDGGTGLITRY